MKLGYNGVDIISKRLGIHKHTVRKGKKELLEQTKPSVPHGIYDVEKNTCYMSIGTNRDTAEFVMNNIEYHWNNSIKNDYPHAKRMLILCDGGGSNSSSHYAVKEQFKRLAEKLRMQTVVAHCPPLLFKMESCRT